MEQENQELRMQVDEKKAPPNTHDLLRSTRNKTGKLKAPPKTMLMNGSGYKDDELGYSRISKTSRANDLGASGVVSRKHIKDDEDWKLTRKMTL